VTRTRTATRSGTDGGHVATASLTARLSSLPGIPGRAHSFELGGPRPFPHAAGHRGRRCRPGGQSPARRSGHRSANARIEAQQLHTGWKLTQGPEHRKTVHPWNTSNKVGDAERYRQGCEVPMQPCHCSGITLELETQMRRERRSRTRSRGCRSTGMDRPGGGVGGIWTRRG
jgi:hypothetical protein